jgi:hypothetical protein
MAEQYEVLTEALIQHAGKLDRIADQVALAAAAAQQMSLPSDAYGSLCLHLALKISALEELGAVALGACGNQLRSAAGRIRATARDYTAIDDANELVLQRAAEVR